MCLLIKQIEVLKYEYNIIGGMLSSLKLNTVTYIGRDE